MSKKPNLFERAYALLAAARKRARANGDARRAARARAGELAIRPPAPKPPAPAPAPVPTAPHGFMPGAIIEAIPAGASDPAITPVGVIQHVAVSNSADLHDQFANDGGIESHFYIETDGLIRQYRSIYREADAQWDGNSWLGSNGKRYGFISVEHEGGVGADLDQPMPQAQLDAFHKVVLWVHAETGFPLRVCPAWNLAGVGYHALFEQWNHSHHSCPGAGRIKQFHDVTLPWLNRGGK